jgi:hypothetical protein
MQRNGNSVARNRYSLITPQFPTLDQRFPVSDNPSTWTRSTKNWPRALTGDGAVARTGYPRRVELDICDCGLLTYDWS